MGLLRNGLNRAYYSVAARFKMPFLMFIRPCKARHKDLHTESIECLSY